MVFGLEIKFKIKLFSEFLKIDNNHLIDNIVTVFTSNYEIIKNIKSEKINIKENNWIIYNPEILLKTAVK